ncbi:MAG: RluA family pseudouridine synthase [Bacilli bacterium]|jgi:23S rRNA pseudouridine1911/1915/1917 synthase
MKTGNYKQNLEFIVEKGSLLLEYLFLQIPNKSKNNIKSLLTRGDVFVNNRSITKYDYKLRVGDKVLIKTNQIHTLDHNETLNLIYEDNDIIVINKPAGLLSMATDNESEKTAYHMVMDYLKKRNHKNRIFIVHRLDKDTSGVLMFAKNEHIKLALQNNWSDIVKVRGYIAIVQGQMAKKSDTIKTWLKETKTLLVYSSRIAGDGQEAITHYDVLKENDRYSLLNIKIDTGRKNQIRVHMKDLEHSIIGDKKYGSNVDPLKRLGLHAHILEFKHPLTGEIMHFEAEIPSRFFSLFKK